MIFWSLLGYFIFGSAFGYGMERWPIIKWAVWVMVGVSFIVDPSAPELQLDGSGWNVVVLIVGVLIGGTIARVQKEAP